MVAYAQDRELFEILRRRGKVSEAAAAVRENLARCRRAFDPSHHVILRIEDRLARALLAEGVHIDEAQTLARHAAEGAGAGLGPEDVLTLLYRDTYAAALRRQGRVTEAEAELRAVLAVGHPDPMLMLAVHQTLGECLIDLSRFDEAEQALRIANEHATSQLDPYDPCVVDLWRAWTRSYEGWGRPADAEPYRVKLALLEPS